ncbi:MAG: ATP-binding cassette domain-containing protein [Bacteroidota bacterium]|nr:ATP-binding cassette domain-containing protein [Bacteroidota bacterium]
MIIKLEHTGKKYNSEWIFRDLNYRFESGYKYAILGKNGSGKSTLLRMISGILDPTEGFVKYCDSENISSQDIFRYITLAAPYQEVIEDFTINELLKFHFSFKNPLPGLTLRNINDLLNFPVSSKKHIREYSSGMKQRIKIALAVFSDVPVILLDEPAMNLDVTGLEWYLELIQRYTDKRLVIVCSNQEKEEILFCTEKIQIGDYKPVGTRIR